MADRYGLDASSWRVCADWCMDANDVILFGRVNACGKVSQSTMLKAIEHNPRVPDLST